MRYNINTCSVCVNQMLKIYKRSGLYEDQTTLCLLGGMLSLLLGPGIRRNVRVAATCADRHEDQDEDEDDDLVLLTGPK